VFSQRFTGASGRIRVQVPPRRGTVGWQLTVAAWPTSSIGVPVVAFVLVNHPNPSAVTAILRAGLPGVPDGGLPLTPGQVVTDFIRKDRDDIWVDLRGVAEDFSGDAAVSVTIELHALYASPECPEPVGPDCSLPPEKRKC
jgi:hypothetical protein